MTKLKSISRGKGLPSNVKESALEFLHKGLLVSVTRKQIKKINLTFMLQNQAYITEKFN